MSCARDARRLADFIVSLPTESQVYQLANQFSYYHIGALFTDLVLQAGLNYSSIVKPRVQQVLLNYPDDCTVKKFQIVIDREGLSNVINWHHEVKLFRFKRLLEFAVSNSIDTCSDLKSYLSKKGSYDSFLAINGFGPKSLDYLLKLLNVDTVAVDRHIYSFVKMAKIETKSYQETKRVVEFAADFLNMPRSALDQIIWNFMSQKKHEASPRTGQLSLSFPGLD